MSDCVIRPARPSDQPAAYYVCLKTGDHGKDGEPLYREDPDALGRIFVGPYYAFGAFDSRKFYAWYEAEWRPDLCAQFPEPKGDPKQWTRVQHVYSWYHHPDYFCPEPYAKYPSHLHIDLLERARGRGYGRRMMEQVMGKLRQRSSPGAHLGVSVLNQPAFDFYGRLEFRELVRQDDVIYMGKSL